MVVYVEYVLIDNFVIDYLMLEATFATTGIRYSKVRLFLCALLGAIIALIYPMLQVNIIILTAVKILSGLLLILIANKYKTIKRYYVHAMIFFGYTFFTGGIIIGIFNLFSINYSTEASIAVMIIPVYMAIRIAVSLVKYVYRRKEVMQVVCDVDITAYGKTQSAKGFIDTGNALFDGESPVIFCTKDFAMRLLNENLLKVRFKKLSVGTVNGAKEKNAFKIEYLKIYNGTTLNIHTNITTCIVDDIGYGYEIILHPALLRGSNNEINSAIKKVS